MSSKTRNEESYQEFFQSLDCLIIGAYTEVTPPEYESIWLGGGADLTQEFLHLSQVDEVRLSVIPVLLGSRVSPFGSSGPGSALHLTDVTAFKTGIVELWYDVIRNPFREDS